MSELHLVRASARRIEVRDASGDDPDAAAAPQFVYLGRQPILDRQGALNAYELLFRAGAHNYAEVTNDAQATAQVVARALGGIGVPAVLGPHRGFVNIDRTMLFDDIVHVMPPERFVLEILETVQFDAQLGRRLGELRRGGFQVALDDVTALSDELLAMLPHADIVKIDFLQTERAHLPELAAAMRGQGKTLIAEKVETREDFALARDLGFDLFQGYFFARPQVLAAPRNRSPRPGLLRLLALLSRDAGIVELEAELKLNPSVVVQLLRLVNSSAFGLGRNIASLREAIIATGTRQIARWAQLLLYADSGDLPWRADPLVQLAATRSRFMELAASWMRPADDEFADAAFMTGIFSLVHVLLGTTPKAVLEKLGLAAQIREAIVELRGPLGMLLRIAEAAGEGADAASIARSADAPPEFAALTPEILAELNLSAAAWFGAHVQEAA
ncbi:EAL domain-containing protein [Paraburkholderia sp. SIMBA_055]|jgi:EAL and modified HD-GYP domain-containing signal transduction protein|uniref:EAL and HDOD domain-containing protein n=1 Tax=Paraburkholderia TaxID=1822464 RepID=UPI000D31A2DF|nr:MULTISPECIES: EAL domain-containing protein [Paraburkholderia]AXF07658.1 diguanylate phosphodiesterase [Paraburkholderia graminis]MDR6466391.1 EAL and modified HD-GYP domain-containing signal transduction protein [Paraburkholderia graminis]MDR6474333.1 EAL and modified HD-GYP domain-containing signal transduction protein [Paraburkholderia graminis]PTQ98640.1 EAL and modified HD-GYP domain-containing signal transduction protein [Paraburkholderia sp. GV072]PUB03883.1 EAL and modified HD-GYP d